MTKLLRLTEITKKGNGTKFQPMPINQELLEEIESLIADPIGAILGKN